MFCFFCFFLLCIHTYVYEFSCWILLKPHKLVNKHDTKDSNEVKEDHNFNYSVGFGAWAQFRDKILMHRKLLNSDCSIAYSFCFFFSFLGTGWREYLWASIQCWSIGLYVWLVSYFLFESFYLFIYQLWMGLDFVVSYYVCSIVNGFRFCCFVLCMQKMAWIREFLQKFTNFKMKINLISIIYKIFVYGLFVYLVGILDFGYLLVFDFGKCKYAQLHIIFSKSACTLHCKVHILLLFCDWI